jgi:putative transposase
VKKSAQYKTRGLIFEMVPHTYTQLFIQLVFAVRGRQSLIASAWKNDLYKYITAIVQNKTSKMLAINGTSDHIHIFIGYSPSYPLPYLVKDIKLASQQWIRTKKQISRFSWQKGYGAFSYSKSQIDAVCIYIQQQEQHHAVKTFQHEYKHMLKQFAVEFNEEYLFEFLE